MGLILIADDDISIANLLSESLQDAGYQTETAPDGLVVLERIARAAERYDLILLDIMMPGMDGLEVCRRIRQRVTCPILFVSARDTQLQQIVGLEIGADDYIVKPFSVAEVVARVNAHIRRENRRSTMEASGSLHLGGLVVTPESYTATLFGERLDLSTREFQILHLLARNRNRVLSREQILDGMQGNLNSDLNVVTVHIRNLRGKFGIHADFIKTVWGVGYKLVDPEG